MNMSKYDKMVECNRRVSVEKVDPRKGILDMVMDNEIAKLHEQIRLLRGENEQLKEENQRLKKALDKKNMNILKNL